MWTLGSPAGYSIAVEAEAVRALAAGVVSLINLYDPEVVILGGGIVNAGEALFRPLLERVCEIEWMPTGDRVRIVRAALGEMAGAWGAAANALNVYESS